MKKSQNSVNKISGKTLMKKKLVPIVIMGPETGGLLHKCFAGKFIHRFSNLFQILKGDTQG
jgi:hypothetical protein